MKAMTATDSLNFVRILLDHAYKKGAFNDTDNGPLDMHTMIECTVKLGEAAALSDQAAIVKQQMQAQMQAQAQQQQQTPRAEKAPCGDCEDKAKKKG